MIDHDGSTGSFWGTVARNYVQYGYLTTKLGVVANAGSLTPSEFTYYMHHPLLPPILLSFGLQIFGLHEWTIRAVYVVFALGSLALLYFLSKKLWNRKISILSCCATLLTPMFLHFSSVPDMVSITLFFSLAAIYAYALWLETESPFSLVVFSVWLLLSIQSSWEGYFLIPAILYHNFLRDRKQIINILVPAIGILSLSAFLIHAWLLVGSMQFKKDFSWAIYRTGMYTIRNDPMFLWQYVKQIFVWTWFLFTPLIFFLGALFFLSYCFKRSSKGFEKNDDFISLFFIFGVLKYFSFFNLSYYHPQRLYYFLPFFTLSSALLINKILEKIRKRVLKLFIIFSLISLTTLNFIYVTSPVFLQLHENDGRSSFIISGYRFSNQQDVTAIQFYDELKESVYKRLGPKDIILTNRWFPQIKYYLNRNTNETISSIDGLKKNLLQVDPNKKILFLFCNWNSLSPNEISLLEYLKKNYRLEKSFLGNEYLIFDIE